MINLTIQQKMDIFTARNNSKPESYRSIEKRLNIDHSTVHHMEPRIRKEIENALKTPLSNSKKLIVRVVMILALLGQMSSRAIAQSVKLLYNKDICHDTVLKILALSSETANKISKEVIDLKNVKTALFDEVFQSKTPILGFTDHYSGLICFRKSDDRSSHSWHQFLELLKSKGLNPYTAIIDGGTGLKRGLILTFGNTIVYVLDLFHLSKKLLEAKNKMEGICYSLIVGVDNKIKKGDDFTKLNEKMNDSIKIFDEYEAAFKDVSHHVYLFNSQSNEYIFSSQLQQHLLKMATLLHKFYHLIRKHNKVNAARSYIENNIKQIIAYKENIEKEVYDKFSDKAPLVFKYFLPIIENFDRFQRSYENNKEQKYWAEKIIKLKKEVMVKGALSEKEYDEVLNNVSKITEKFAKSNSLIENINNQIRRYLDTYKTIPHWFCDLFSFYWNFKVFQRGKRAGSAPIELLTKGKLKCSWLDLILNNFPYEKIRTSLTEA